MVFQSRGSKSTPKANGFLQQWYAGVLYIHHSFPPSNDSNHTREEKKKRGPPIPSILPINRGLLAHSRRHPLTALPRLYLGNIHCINLLQRPPLRLADEEIHNQDGSEIAPGKHVTVLEPDVPDDEGREEGDEEIPRPVGGRDERHAARAVVRREELADDAPDDGSPGRGVKGNEEAGEDDHGGAGGWGGGRVGVVEREGANGCKYEEVDGHTDAAHDEGPSTAKTLHYVEAKEGHAKVDTAKDHGSHKAVVDACGFYTNSRISIALLGKT